MELQNVKITRVEEGFLLTWDPVSHLDSHHVCIKWYGTLFSEYGMGRALDEDSVKVRATRLLIVPKLSDAIYTIKLHAAGGPEGFDLWPDTWITIIAHWGEVTVMTKAKNWVAEHVMGFERGNCWSATSNSSAGSDGTFETWFSCDRCGRVVYNNKTVPCCRYPFPEFTLVDLMRKLGEKGYHVMVRVDPEREHHKFTVVLNSRRISDTDSPLKSLCNHLCNHRETWQRLEDGLGPWHGLRKSEKKHFVSGEQVLEEYVPGYKRSKGQVDGGKLVGEPQDDNYTVEKATDEMCNIACRICPYTTPESRLDNACRWSDGMLGRPAPALSANIRDAIKLLQKAVGQVEEK